MPVSYRLRTSYLHRKCWTRACDVKVASNKEYLLLRKKYGTVDVYDIISQKLAKNIFDSGHKVLNEWDGKREYFSETGKYWYTHNPDLRYPHTTTIYEIASMQEFMSTKHPFTFGQNESGEDIMIVNEEGYIKRYVLPRLASC
ncbi:MAG: hypothetical protein AAF770_03905 [Bacteroidota bacterium]